MQPLYSVANAKKAKETFPCNRVRLPLSGSEWHRFLSRAKINIKLHQYCLELIPTVFARNISIYVQ